jgi:hypothetical protein
MYALSSRFAFCATASLGKCTPALNPPQLASAAASSLFSGPNQISHMHQVPGSHVPFLTMTILSLVFPFPAEQIVVSSTCTRTTHVAKIYAKHMPAIAIRT